MAQHTHDVYDTGKYFEINGISRFIKETSDTKLVLVQGDHNSEVITFQMPRYIDGHDMLLCNKIRVHYINLDTKTNDKSADIYEVTDLALCEECEDETLTFTWKIEAPATKYFGNLSFLIKFECTEGENILYQWNTAKYVGTNVLAGIDNSEEFVEKYSNVLEEWYNELTKGADSIEELNQQALTEIEHAKEDAKEDIQGKANSTMAEMIQFSSNAYNSFKNDVDAKAKQTLESIPEEYTELDADVKDLKSDLDNLISVSKNLLNLETITSDIWISNTSGNIQPYSGWSATDYIPIDGLSTLFFVCIRNGIYEDVGGNFGAYYDVNKTYITGFDGVPLGRTIPTNAKFVRISNESKYFDESVKPIISSVDIWNPKPSTIDKYKKYGEKNFDDSDKNLPNVYDAIEQLEKNGYTIPSYYTEHIEAKELQIRSNYEKCGVNGDSFVFITDYHDTSNSGNSVNLIRHIMDYSPVRFVCLNGDLINDRQTKDLGMQALLSVIKNFSYLPTDKFFVTVGNHEFNNAGNSDSYRDRQLSLNEVYSSVNKISETFIREVDGLDFYVDNESQKVRYYFIGSSIGCNPYSKANKWFADSLSNIDNNYKIIVFSHIGLNNTATDWDSSLDVIVSILEAYKNNTSYTLDDTSYDFSTKNGDVVGVFSGHMHLDGSLTTTSGIPFIATTCDAYKEEYGDLTRTKETITEQAFDVVQIDFDNRKIYMTRIGAGVDREFTF